MQSGYVHARDKAVPKFPLDSKVCSHSGCIDSQKYSESNILCTLCLFLYGDGVRMQFWMKEERRLFQARESGVGLGAVRMNFVCGVTPGCDISRAMGRTLEIGDIHSPTVPQRPVSKAAEDLNELLDEKLVLEETLGHFADILEKHGVGMSSPTSNLPWSLTTVRHVDTVG